MQFPVVRLKPVTLKIHRWFGLALGVVILVQAFTGCIVAFRDELKIVLHHDAMMVQPGNGDASLQAIVSAARAATGNAKITRIDYPQTNNEAYFVTGTAPDSDAVVFASVDYGGHVLRSGGLFAWPTELAFHVHHKLASGTIGMDIVGFTGLWVLIMAISGPIYWWPGRKRLKRGFDPDLGNGAYRATRGLHRVAGAVMAPVLGLIALTGLLMAWSAWVTPLVALIVPITPSPAPKAVPATCAQMRPLDDAVNAAINVMPGQALKSVRFKGRTGQVVAIYFRAKHAVPSRLSDHVWVDGCTAKVLAVEDNAHAQVGDKFFDWLLPIHSGTWLGWPGRILSFFGAVTLFFLSGAGYALWFSRTARLRKAARSRQAA